MMAPTSSFPLASSPVTVNGLDGLGNAGTFEPATLAAPAPPGLVAVGEHVPLPPSEPPSGGPPSLAPPSSAPPSADAPPPSPFSVPPSAVTPPPPVSPALLASPPPLGVPP